jgi:hypothetical protein
MAAPATLTTAYLMAVLSDRTKASVGPDPAGDRQNYLPRGRHSDSWPTLRCVIEAADNEADGEHQLAVRIEAGVS